MTYMRFDRLPKFSGKLLMQFMASESVCRLHILQNVSGSLDKDSCPVNIKQNHYFISYSFILPFKLNYSSPNCLIT